MDLERPAVLYALIPVALLVVASAWRNRSTLPPGRVVGCTIARLVVVSLALLALSGPRLPVIEPVGRPLAILVDVSDSVPLAAREAALRSIARLARSASPGTETWVIAFAGGARAHRLANPATVETDAALRELILFPAADTEARRALERVPAASSPPSASSSATAEATLHRIDALRQALDPSETDLHAALRALGGCPAGGRSPALVLVTDGRLTRAFGPSDWSALREAAGTVVLADTGGADPGIVVESVSAPPSVDAGQPFDAIVRFAARGGESARIRLLIDDRPQGDVSQTCAPGSNVATIPRLAIEEPGFHRLQVIVAAEGDPEPRNNAGIALVHVGPPPVALLVEGRPGLGVHLEGALQIQGIRVERIEAARLPARRETLARFGAVLLVGVDADQIPDAASEALRAAVEEDGVGLLFAGGPHLAGPKSWLGRPPERLLPVAFGPFVPATPPPAAPTPPDAGRPPAAPSAPKPVVVEAGTISLCLLIDKSGSMAGDNIRLAREAAIAAAETLGSGDRVSVIAFDVEPKMVLEPTDASRKDHIRDRIARIQADGGTNVHPALQLAFRLLRGDPAQVRHAIVMSDGITQIADYQGLLGQMQASRITVSSVCVASDLTFDWTMMHNLAVWGGGRFYPALSFKEVPQIFTKETKVVVEGREKDRAAREQQERARAAAAAATARPPSPPTPPSTPSPPPPAAPVEIPLRIVAEEDAVRGLSSAPLPSVDGLLPAAARPASVTCISAGEDRPALVLGRAGLGRTAAWLSDWSDTWGRRWLGWDRFPAFSAQLARRLLRRSAPDRFPGTVTAAIRGGSVRVSVDFREAAARSPEGRFVLQSAWRGERGPEHPLELRPVAPALAEAEFPAPEAGEAAYIRVRLQDGKRTWEAPPVGVARAYPEELAGTPSTAFADAAASGIPPAVPLDLADVPPLPPPAAGRRTVPWAAPFLIAALLLLPFDIALRRLRL